MGLPLNQVLELTGMTKHQYYYKSKNNNGRGRKKSLFTFKKEGSDLKKIDNTEVVEIIRNRQSDIDLQSGYQKMTKSLMLLGFIINHKKVYRLMDENQLLLERPKKASKEYVKYRILTPKDPLTSFEMDIKQVYCTEKSRYAYILSVIDTFTRVVVYWEVRYNIKHQQVLRAWQNIINHIIQPFTEVEKEIHIEVRNDNGPQFSAKNLRMFFKENSLKHVFTHPYTPEENGHIESFHAIISKTLEKYTFWSIEDLEKRLDIFYQKYNNERIHGSVANLPPVIFWRMWNDDKIIRKELSKRKVKFTLKGSYQEISENTSLKEAPCINLNELDAYSNLNNQEVDELYKEELITLKNNYRYKTSPSIAPCENKNMKENNIFARAS